MVNDNFLSNPFFFIRIKHLDRILWSLCRPGPVQKSDNKFLPSFLNLFFAWLLVCWRHQLKVTTRGGHELNRAYHCPLPGQNKGKSLGTFTLLLVMWWAIIKTQTTVFHWDCKGLGICTHVQLLTLVIEDSKLLLFWAGTCYVSSVTNNVTKWLWPLAVP